MPDFQTAEQQIVAEALAEPNRDEAAKVYARALSVFGVGDLLDWEEVNKGLLSRWSMSGLVYIKEKAWAMLKKETDHEA